MSEKTTLQLKQENKEFIENGNLLILKNNFMTLAALALKESFENSAEKTRIARELGRSGFYYYKKWRVYVRFSDNESINVDFDRKTKIIAELAENARSRVGI